MTCNKISSMLSDYVDGCLSDSMCEEVETHVSECEVCADELESTRTVVVTLSHLSDQRCPIDCWVGVRKFIVDKRREMPFWKRWLITPAIAIPALAVLIMMMFFVWPSPVHETALSQMHNTEYDHFISAHSRLQRLQTFSDHDATFVEAELENASYTPDAK